MWLKPRNENVSDLLVAHFCRFGAASDPNSISRVFSGVQSHTELLQVSSEFLEEAFGIAAVLET
jgi:hypothetical protein